MNWYDALITFSQVAEFSSFSAAARHLDTNPAIVTKHIQWLEANLAVNLFFRTTRSVTMTEAGKHLFSRVKPWLEEFSLIKASIEDLDHQPSGEVTIAGTSNFLSYKPIVHWLNACLKTYPKIQLSTKTYLNRINLAESNIDIYLGVDKYILNCGDVIGRTLKHFHYACYASPGYLDNHSPIESPLDLDDHNCLMYQNQPWELNNEYYLPSGNFIADSGRFMYASALEDLGIIYVPNIFADHYCKSGRLIRVMPQYRSNDFELKCYYPKMNYQPKKVSAVVEYLIQQARG